MPCESAPVALNRVEYDIYLFHIDVHGYRGKLGGYVPASYVKLGWVNELSLVFSLQIKTNMKRKAVESAGLPAKKSIPSNNGTKQGPSVTIKKESSQQAALAATILAQQKQTSADITLNMLNATENEVDVVGLTEPHKLEYDSD